MEYTLLIKPENDLVKSFYEKSKIHHLGDSGFDLYVTEDVVFNVGDTKFVDLKIQCEMVDENNENVSYYLYPRSSIAKTPLMLCNSVGIIDSGYRGNIISALRYISFKEDSPYVLTKGTKIVQICSPSLKQLKFKIVNELSDSSRKNGGFGSTNSI